MAREDRMRERKARDRRKNIRVPELGYYLIVTDTEATERLFFMGMRDSLPEDIKKKIVIKVEETRTRMMIDKCLELTAYDPQYRIPWIVFDRDRVPDFDKIIEEAISKNVQVGWSNPCFEIWMYAYFGSMPAIKDSWTCCSEFAEIYKKRTGSEYKKAENQLYKRLCEYGDEDKAIKVADDKLKQLIRAGKIKPSEMYPATMVHELVREIKNKAK